MAVNGSKMADGSQARSCPTSNCPMWPKSPIDLYSFNFLTITNSSG